jgi:hypothetical protein
MGVGRLLRRRLLYLGGGGAGGRGGGGGGLLRAVGAEFCGSARGALIAQ